MSQKISVLPATATIVNVVLVNKERLSLPRFCTESFSGAEIEWPTALTVRH